MNYTAKIKGIESFIPNETNEIRLTKTNDKNYILHTGGINYKAIVLNQDLAKKQFQFNINGKIIDIQLQDDLDRLVEKMEFNKGDKLADKILNSPMPGIILSVDVSVGDEVNIGDKLFTLEAMKMENIIKSSVEGIVKTVDVDIQNAVEKGQLLLCFE